VCKVTRYYFFDLKEICEQKRLVCKIDVCTKKMSVQFKRDARCPFDSKDVCAKDMDVQKRSVYKRDALFPFDSQEMRAKESDVQQRGEYKIDVCATKMGVPNRCVCNRDVCAK